jgi:glucose-6-phosphate dehydrogenase assembly protein OpcA
MNIDLADTTTRRIQDALTQARHLMGGPAIGMVLTLIIVTDESAQYDAVRAATEASREHPCRVLTVISRDARGSSSRLDAEIRMGETGPGETVLLRMYGPLAEHADSVVVPLLMPDTPVVTWWPGGKVPQVPSRDPLGRLAQRRVTDSYAAPDRLGTLARLAEAYSPGDTDFTWTRLTNWRSLLAAALDQGFDTILSGEVSAEPDSPSAELLAAWLAIRLGIQVTRVVTDGPGITGVRLTTGEGDIAVSRPDGRVATLSRPGQPARQVALMRRPTANLLSEELRRLDPDEMYAETLQRLDAPGIDAEPDPEPTPEPEPSPTPVPGL